MADESKQYENFDLQVTEEKFIVTIKAGTSMFESAAAMHQLKKTDKKR
jgi:hypothetical protein